MDAMNIAKYIAIIIIAAGPASGQSTLPEFSLSSRALPDGSSDETITNNDLADSSVSCGHTMPAIQYGNGS